MKPFFLLLGLFLVIPATGQEHAPTAAQCQADAAVWGDTQVENRYLDAQTSDQTEIGRLSYREVAARMTEMGACRKVDPLRENKYYEISSFYSGVVLSSRVFDFMTRHDLWGQFKLEDTQGKR